MYEKFVFILVKIAIVVSVGWRQIYQIKSEKNALGKNVLSKGTQRNRIYANWSTELRGVQLSKCTLAI